jgi:hypothetical protein
MDRTLLALVVLGILVVLFALMLFGWLARQKRQSGLPIPESPPENLGAGHGRFGGLYVATTVADEPLNRIAVGGLGFRAKTTLTVADAGIVLPIAGQRDILIPAATIRDVSTATWVIDKAVEPDGLSRVGWKLGATNVDSYFRLDSPEEFLTTAKKLATG